MGRERKRKKGRARKENKKNKKKDRNDMQEYNTRLYFYHGTTWCRPRDQSSLPVDESFIRNGKYKDLEYAVIIFR